MTSVQKSRMATGTRNVASASRQLIGRAGWNVLCTSHSWAAFRVFSLFFFDMPVRCLKRRWNYYGFCRSLVPSLTCVERDS